ncbi:MAG TPA: hypothetical protein VFG68_09965 [Fimbriiglobus sp.]|nr:hypothetical protein [Fimbriiglobus sp.]
MTEADWLRAKDPDGMLRVVERRLSPRQWHLLACAVVRRAWDAVPAGPPRDALEWAERNAGAAADRPEAAEFLPHLEPAARAGADAAREVQRQIVLAADPDADPDSFHHTLARKTNPSAVLFQAACRAAGTAVEEAGEAVPHAVEAVAALLALPPGPAQLARVRELVIEATRSRAGSSLYASLALKLKDKGDEEADQDGSRSVRVRYSTACNTAQREEEFANLKHSEQRGQMEKADRKALGRSLLDLVGNPYRPYRFEPAWRTSTVLGLAKAIVADRAFDRMPILGDALLDADCDEEALLRHCRGTEAHAPDSPTHGRGCWVLDLILGAEPAFFAAGPHRADRPARPPAAGWSGLIDVLRAGNLSDPDDQDE